MLFGCGGNGVRMNKKISRLLEPNLILYFLLLAAFAAATMYFVPWLGVIQMVVTIMTNMNIVSQQHLKALLVKPA